MLLGGVTVRLSNMQTNVLKSIAICHKICYYKSKHTFRIEEIWAFERSMIREMEQLSLFSEEVNMSAPLASRVRPGTLNDYIGQEHLLGPGKVLRQMLEKDLISSMIFWGPPGVGKTTLARIIANMTRSSFIDFSAVTSGIKEIKEVMKQAESSRLMGQKTIVFVDEIHRFNKAQQDAFLPYVEKGSIILIGATTENPSFEINSALLSRCKVFVLQALTTEDMGRLLRQALTDRRGLGSQTIYIEERLLNAIAVFANGDARMALNTLDMAVLNGRIETDGSVTVGEEVLEQCTGRKMLLYDRNGEEHYNLISALHKSMRTAIRTRPFTGWQECWKPGRILFILPGG